MRGGGSIGGLPLRYPQAKKIALRALNGFGFCVIRPYWTCARWETRKRANFALFFLAWSLVPLEG